METPSTPIALEYLKVLLTWPVTFLFVSLVAIFNFKKPLSNWLSYLRIDYGGATFSSQQRSTSEEPSLKADVVIKQETPKADPVPQGGDGDLVAQWRANAYIWEYRYLNWVLVLHTQQVLDWLYDLGKGIDIEVANSVWLLHIPSPAERDAVLKILLQHSLVSLDGKQLSITPKGREYVELRGKVAPAFPTLTKQRG